MARDKFIVWKLEDLLAVTTQAELQLLNTVVERMIRKREEDGKSTTPNYYLIINTDEPYAEEVKDILKRNGDWDE